MGNFRIFSSAHTHLGVNYICVTGVLNKNRLRKCTITRDKQLKEKEKGNVATLNSAHQAEKQFDFDSGWLEQVSISPLCPCLDLGPFMSDLYDLFLIFIFILFRLIL